MENRTFSAEDITGRIDTALDDLDKSRAREMELAKNLLEEKHRHLEKEKQRMEAKYGPDHPQVQKIEARLVYARSLQPILDAEIERSKVSPPPMPATSWRVHGQVFNKDNSTQEGLTVFLADEKFQWVRTLPFAVTDQQGYYALTVEQKQITALKKQKLLLGVSTRAQKVIYRGTEAFIAEPGVIEYRNLTVDLKGEQEPPAGEENPDAEYEVVGKVTNARNKPVPGLRVRAVNVDPAGERPLGQETVTGRDGTYRISYKAADFTVEGRATTGADIIIYIYNSEGAQIYKSEVFKNSQRTQTIDIQVDVPGNRPA